MTQNHLYLSDTYCFHASSTVIDRGSDEQGHWLILRDNIFHPQGGGQPADSGWIDALPARVKRHADGRVALYTAQPGAFQPGDSVETQLAVEPRLHHAALHTAGHLLNWTLRRYGWRATAGHHFPGESRVEFVAAQPDAVAADRLSLEDIGAELNARLHDGGEVTTWQDGATRFCLIAGAEPAPCAGTHVDNLNKIAHIELKSLRFKKGVLRVSYDADHVMFE